MSIEYFVEGEVRQQFGGNIIAKSKEIVENNAAISVEQKGTENGVSYDEPNKINPNDKPVNMIDVSLNLFFDGTGNNKSNTEARKANSEDYQQNANMKNDSYENEFSNVAKGYDTINPNTENQEVEYIEGVGTVDLQGDNVFPGQALGTGGTGVKGKVTKGCIKGAAKLGKYKGRPIDILKVNVFGFSRGAAAARYFVHVASNPPQISYSQGKKVLQVFPPENLPEAKTLIINDEDGTKLPFILQYGYFGAQLIERKLNVKKIVFNFVGLYDTVASYGVVHKNDTEDLGLNSISKSYFVLQLASDDEYRSNFRLTNINSTILHGLELTLPGVHSDIGGAYRNGHEEAENSLQRYEEKTLFKSDTKEECTRFRNMLIDEGWFRNAEIKIYEIKQYMKGVNYNYKTKYELRGKRILSNHYDRIPLNLMYHYSKQGDSGVKYLDDRISKKLEINELLSSIYIELLNYITVCNKKRNDYITKKTSGNYLQDIKATSYLHYISNENLKLLRNRYLHWSVDYGDIIVNGENVSGVLPASQRKRTIQNG